MRRRASPAGVLGARVAVALVLCALAFPPVRRVAVRAGRAIYAGVEAQRAVYARERVIAGYARRYGITRDLADVVERTARAERIDPELGFRMVRVESEFNPRAVSPVGALGLTQLMPATAAELAPGISRDELLEPETNLRLGFRYLRALLGVYGGDREEALHAYNRGMGTIARIRAGGGDPANGYAARVLGREGASRVPGGAAPATDAAPVDEPLHELGPALLPATR